MAYKAYSVYLRTFPATKYSYDIRYAFGELLYKIMKYDRAYEQYMKVVEMDPKGEHSRFCAESAVFAATEMVKREQGEARARWEQQLRTACDQYSSLYLGSEETPALCG
jgi:TolA-binding protein